MTTTLGFGLPSIGPLELIVLLVIGLLLFGRRLPEIGKSLGRSIVEFKKGVRDVTDEVEQTSSRPSAYQQTAALPKAEVAPIITPPAQVQGEEVRVSRSDKVE